MNIRTSMIWDILSVMMLAATAVVLLIYGIIFLNPTVAFNVFAPQSQPAVVVLDTATPTLLSMPATITSTATITLTPTITKTPTITSTQPTSTMTTSPTITGTLPTATTTYTPSLSPTVTRTSTKTTNPLVYTQIAQTAISGTKTKAVDLTHQAATDYKIQLTNNAQKTKNAALTQTQAAVNLTLTAAQLTSTYAVGTATQGAVETATQAAVNTATQAVIETATSTAITQVAEQTRTEQAQIELELPIAYSVDTNGNTDTAEQFITQRLSGGTNGPAEYTLAMSVSHPNASPASGWWMGEADNHYLLFTDPDDLNPIFRVLYQTTVTIEQIVNGLGKYITGVVVNKQSGVETDRIMAFSYAVGGFGTDRNVWILKWNSGLNGGAGGWDNVQLNSDPTSDDHSPHFISSSGGTYAGRVLYVAGPSSSPENIVITAPQTGASITQVTFYDDFATTEISTPKWCTGYDWENEETFHRIIFGMRTSSGDDWDLYMADPYQLIADGHNDSITRLMNTSSINEWNPDWSPFCNRVTYLSDEGGSTNVWTFSITPDGVISDKLALTNNALTQMSPLWMPYKP